MSKKYLRKSEFRKYYNPKHLSKTGEPHKAYISLRYKDSYRFNVITHAKSFFGEKTEKLYENPNRNIDKPKDKRPSMISIPRWDKKTKFSKDILSGWKFSKKDKKRIEKMNRNYFKNKNQP